MSLDLKYTLDEGAYPIERAHSTDAGIDLKTPHEVVLPAKGQALVHTGVHVQLPHGYAGLIVAKSGLHVKHGITSTGLIDEGYIGELVVSLLNHSDREYVFHIGDKVSQLVILPVAYTTPTKVDSLVGGERGDNGFGSTGK